MKNIPLKDFYFCPSCGLHASNPPGPGENQSELDRTCKCGHVWKVGTESELERAALLIQQASLIIGQAIRVVPPFLKQHSSLRVVRGQSDVAISGIREWLEKDYPHVKSRLPRP